MSSLTSFRDHCRAMSEAEHTPECEDLLKRWSDRKATSRWFAVPDPGPRPECSGCVSAADQALFARLAAEVDDYLTPQPDLFGEPTVEPTTTEESA